MADTRVEEKEEIAHKSDQSTPRLYSEVHAVTRDHKTLLQSNALFDYILETSVYPREPAPLRELREMTAKHLRSGLSISADEGQFLMMLLKIMNAKNTLELGVFTGYSLLCTALALPHDGKIIAMDMNRENYELGVPFMKKAGVHHKIDFQQGKALSLLDELLQDDKYLAVFDFVFVDADKENSLSYHKRIMKLLKVNGIVVYDNTLWCGSVVEYDDACFPGYVTLCKFFVLELNKALVEDPRILTSAWCPLEMVLLFAKKCIDSFLD